MKTFLAFLLVLTFVISCESMGNRAGNSVNPAYRVSGLPNRPYYSGEYFYGEGGYFYPGRSSIRTYYNPYSPYYRSYPPYYMYGDGYYRAGTYSRTGDHDRGLRFPKITAPKFETPSIHTPKFNTPKVHTPHFHAPKGLPKIRFGR